jgi:hypothetical protein
LVQVGPVVSENSIFFKVYDGRSPGDGKSSYDTLGQLCRKINYVFYLLHECRVIAGIIVYGDGGSRDLKYIQHAYSHTGLIPLLE